MIFSILPRGHVAKGAVRSDSIVLLSPLLDRLPSFLKCLEPVAVQTLFAEARIEALDERVLNGLAWADEVQMDAVAVSPLIEGLRGELRSVIDADHRGHADRHGKLSQNLCNTLAAHPDTDLQGRTHSTKVIH